MSSPSTSSSDDETTHPLWLLFAEEALSYPILAQLLRHHWVDTYSENMFRLLRNPATLRAWARFVSTVAERYGAHRVEEFKDDTRGLILVLDTCVIKTFRRHLFYKIRPIYQIHSPYLEQCLATKIVGPLGCFVCEKIFPARHLPPPLHLDLPTVNHDIRRALSTLHRHGVCHGDASLDNCGYRPSTQTYVLFDFDSACTFASGIPNRQKDACFQRDYRQWESSLNYHRRASA